MNDKQLQHEYREWLTKQCTKFDTPVIGTLTYAYPVSVLSAQKSCRTFHKKLSKFVYKNAYNKYKKMIKFIPFMESATDKDRHIHFVVDAHHVPASSFIGYINSRWHGGIKDVKPLDDNLHDKWIKYISKRRTKPEYGDSLILSCTKI